jgi:YbgC/YbaW family acyl-CoA thioester hydrolase
LARDFRTDDAKAPVFSTRPDQGGSIARSTASATVFVVTKDAFTHADLAESPPLYSEQRLVRFHDVDAASIVFYPRVLEYFSDAYMGWFSARGHSVARALATETYGLPLAHAEADYARPLRFGDPIDVAVVKVAIGERSFRVGYRVTTEAGELAAFGQTVHVCIDRLKFKAIPIPEAILKVLSS